MTYRITVPELREELDRWLDRLARGDSLQLVTPAQLLTLPAGATSLPNGDQPPPNTLPASNAAGYWKRHQPAVMISSGQSNAELIAEARGER